MPTRMAASCVSLLLLSDFLCVGLRLFLHVVGLWARGLDQQRVSHRG